MPSPFKRQQVADKDLQLVQDNVSSALAPLQAMPMVGGSVLRNVNVGTTQTALSHSLGRTPSFWILLDQQQAATVWRSAASDSNFLYLTASIGCVVSLWIN